MDQMNIGTARSALHRLIDGWRTANGSKPVYIGPYGTPEAVLAPLAVWHRLLAVVAESWDAQTAAARASRLDDPAGPQPADLGELARVAGCVEPPMPVLPSRGVPRGAAALAVWPQALDDLRKLAALAQQQGTPIAALRALGQLLQGRAIRTESRCGHGCFYTVTDVDGLHVAVVTTRTVPRPAGRRGGGGYETVELIGADYISW